MPVSFSCGGLVKGDSSDRGYPNCTLRGRYENLQARQPGGGRRYSPRPAKDATTTVQVVDPELSIQRPTETWIAFPGMTLQDQLNTLTHDSHAAGLGRSWGCHSSGYRLAGSCDCQLALRALLAGVGIHIPLPAVIHSDFGSAQIDGAAEHRFRPGECSHGRSCQRRQLWARVRVQGTRFSFSLSFSLE